MTHDLPRIDNELELLAELVPLDGQRIIELGCGAAWLLRDLLLAHPGSEGLALEVDERQHAKNLAQPQQRLRFAAGGAQAIAQPMPASIWR
jgi:precorrin-6B methylase 2